MPIASHIFAPNSALKQWTNRIVVEEKVKADLIDLFSRQTDSQPVNLSLEAFCILW